MGRSPLFTEIARALRIARFCDAHRLSTADGLERVREAEAAHISARHSRREFLKAVARTGAAGTAAFLTTPVRRLLAISQKGASPDIGIVGAGIAGLACADTLASAGVSATLYDANTRTGGRCWSLRGFFPGQVAERGGEFIDNLHKTMLQYAQRFDLALEDVTKEPGDVFYYFGGQHVPESTVVDEFRDFVGTMRFDLRRLSQEVKPTSPNMVSSRTSRAA
jgi:monoamine oxidase